MPANSRLTYPPTLAQELARKNQETRGSQRDALDNAAKAQFASIERFLTANPHLRKEFAGFNLPRAADGVPRNMAPADFQKLISRMTAAGDKFQIPGAMSSAPKAKPAAKTTPAVAPAPAPNRANPLPGNNPKPPPPVAAGPKAPDTYAELGTETAAQMEARTSGGTEAALDAQGIVQDGNKAKPLGQDAMNERASGVQDAIAGRTPAPVVSGPADTYSSLSPEMAAKAARFRQQLVNEGRITQDGKVIPVPKAAPAADPHGMPYLNRLAGEFAKQTTDEIAGRASGAGYDSRNKGDTFAALRAEQEPAAPTVAPARYTPTAGGGMKMVSQYGTGSRAGTPPAIAAAPAPVIGNASASAEATMPPKTNNGAAGAAVAAPIAPPTSTAGLVGRGAGMLIDNTKKEIKAAGQGIQAAGQAVQKGIVDPAKQAADDLLKGFQGAATTPTDATQAVNDQSNSPYSLLAMNGSNPAAPMPSTSAVKTAGTGLEDEEEKRRKLGTFAALAA